MRIVLFILCWTLLADAAEAGMPEAREIARINNCAPKKVEIFQSNLGGKVIYQVTCTLPKTTQKDDKGSPDALLIGCDAALCEMMRPLALDKK